MSLLACGSQQSSDPPVTNRLPVPLRAAIKRTLAVKSLRARTTGGATLTAIYQAPDRVFRIETPSAGGAATAMTISRTYIGTVMYTQVPGRPTAPTELIKGTSGHLAALNQVMQPILVLATAKQASATGNAYAFSAVIRARQPGTTDITETGTAVVQDGYIVRIDIRTAAGDGGFAITDFDQFNTAPPVEPPVQ